MATLTITVPDLALIGSGGNMQAYELTFSGVPGQLVSFDGTGKLQKADADDETKAKAIGLLWGYGASGEWAPVALNGTMIEMGAILGAGKVYFANTNEGLIGEYADLLTGHYATSVLHAFSTSRALISIRQNDHQIP